MFQLTVMLLKNTVVADELPTSEVKVEVEPKGAKFPATSLWFKAATRK